MALRGLRAPHGRAHLHPLPPLAAETSGACFRARSEKLCAHLVGGRAKEPARANEGGRQGGGGEGDCLHEFPSGRPASALCPMRSVRGGTRLTFPHHFTVTFGRQAGSHAGALSPELVDLFGISLPPRSSSAVAGLRTDGSVHLAAALGAADTQSPPLPPRVRAPSPAVPIGMNGSRRRLPSAWGPFDARRPREPTPSPSSHL